MLFEIKNRFNGEVIFKLECGSFKICIEAAIEQKADLRSADLSSADLSSANLSSADLSSADLSSADLSSADLSSANLPAPTIILLASWGSVSAKLCVELMRYDAYNHHNPKSFDKWKEVGECPYSGTKYQRVANFSEDKDLWVKWNAKLKVKSAFELMTMLIKEKCKDSDYHGESKPVEKKELSHRPNRKDGY